MVILVTKTSPRAYVYTRIYIYIYFEFFFLSLSLSLPARERLLASARANERTNERTIEKRREKGWKRKVNHLVFLLSLAFLSFVNNPGSNM